MILFALQFLGSLVRQLAPFSVSKVLFPILIGGARATPILALRTHI